MEFLSIGAVHIAADCIESVSSLGGGMIKIVFKRPIRELGGITSLETHRKLVSTRSNLHHTVKRSAR